jgi:hypothetical protein
MSLTDHHINQPSFDISPIWTPIIAAKSANYTPTSVDCVRKLCFYVGTIQRVSLFTDGLYSETTPILDTSR